MLAPDFRQDSRCMKPDIPPEQLERISPVVEALLAGLNDRLQKLAADAESALVFQPDLEPAE
jgi:hypothetical protein